MSEEIKVKYLHLVEYLKSFDSMAVAFSGGVDSTLLTYAAKEALGDNMKAYTISTAYIPGWELNEAITFAKDHHIRHEIVDMPVNNELKQNPANRCYLCKHHLFSELKRLAGAGGFKYMAEGSNTDDDADYRPGRKALKELDVLSPLKECNLNKANIREISKELGLPTFDKPAYACLLTRIPYNTEIKRSDLEKIEQAELFLFGKGIKACRVRIHGALARIEVNKSDMNNVLSVHHEIVNYFKEIGFEHVTMDLQGYRMGSFNETIHN